MKIITVKQVEFIAFRLAQEMLTFDEPIPDFSTRTLLLGLYKKIFDK